MGRGSRQKLRKQRRKLRRTIDDGMDAADGADVPPDIAKRILETSFGLDPQRAAETIIDENGEKRTVADSSNARYTRNLRVLFERGCPLEEGDAHEINLWMDNYREREDPETQTVRGFQIAARHYHRCHEDSDVDPKRIALYESNGESPVDPEDVWTHDEVHKTIRMGGAAAPYPDRDRALFSMFVYTGQRLDALLNLKLRHVDPTAGRFQLPSPTDADLKGADRRGRARLLFGAERPVREWKNVHPLGGEDDYLFISDPDHPRATEGPISESAARNAIEKMADAAEINKPTSFKIFRHTFATMMYRDYNLKPDVIRYLLGHSKGSKQFERIYRHLEEEEFLQEAANAAGISSEQDEQAELAPPIACPTCGDGLKPDSRACPNCGKRFGPVAPDVQRLNELEEEITEVAIKATDESRQNGLAALREALQQPEEVLSALGYVMTEE